jgi:Kef-type K+ transport system membrane component KefB
MNEFAFYLFLFSLGAFFVPILSKFLRLPAFVGEILYGFALQHLLQPGNSSLELIDFLAQMGFIFLMFLAGLELNFDNFQMPVLIQSTIAAIILQVFCWTFWYFYLPEYNAFIPILLSAASAGVAFLALKSQNQTESALGQQVIWTCSIGELFSIILMIIYETTHRSVNAGSLTIIMEISLLFLFLLGAYILIRLILLFFWIFPESVYNVSGRSDSTELGVRMALMVMLSMVALASFLRLEVILGAFLGGIMMSFIFKDSEQIQEKLSVIGYGFFIPFFFMRVGWEFTLPSEDLTGLLSAALITYTIFYALRLPASIFLIKGDKSLSLSKKMRAVFAVNFLLAAPLTLLVALAELGLKVSVIDGFVYRVSILSAMLSGILGPFFFTLLQKKLLTSSE